jgi:hypothetical protein
VSDVPTAVPELPIRADEIEDAAHRLRLRAGAVSPCAGELTEGWHDLRARYDAPEAEELIERMTVLMAGGAQTSEAFSRVGEVLSELSDALRLIEKRRAAAVEEVGHGAGAGAAAGADLDLAIARLRSDSAGVLDEACRGLAGVAAPPPLPLATNGPPEPFIGPRITWGMRAEEAARDILLTPLVEAARGGAGRVRTLLADQPEWAERIHQRPPAPGPVRDWWDALAPAARTALTDGAPAVVGALGGVPPLARVAANRVVARERIPVIEQEIARYSALLGEGSLATLRAERQSAIDRLVVERAYLDRVVAGDVQLVLYEPEQNRIAEMIGTPGPDTRRVLTYVPGTFTSIESFYRGGAQAMPAWLTEQGDGMVAFVWKGVEFPGDDEGSSLVEQLIGIGEANEQKRATQAGEALATFVEAMRTDADIGSARQIAGGYSWGLVPVAGSEVAGVRYDAVHSLAGAWVPPDWTAASTTRYFHWSYTDFLAVAQDMGWVGQGRNPDVMPGFEKRIYDRPGDYDMRLGGELAPFLDPVGPPLRLPASPLENHDLIVEVSAENFPLLNSLSEEMFR